MDTDTEMSHVSLEFWPSHCFVKAGPARCGSDQESEGDSTLIEQKFVV